MTNSVTQASVLGGVIRYDPSILPSASDDLFDPAWLKKQGLLQGQATGRGEAYFFHVSGVDLVLRHFRRGGVVGRLVHDLYVRTGADRSRAFLEYDLLVWMRTRELPVPRPVAARYVAKGLFYRADLITERLPKTRPLADELAHRPLPGAVWQHIGATIRRFHDSGVDHTDLNCRNILLDAAHKAWLIDFDKCKRRAPGEWRAANLARLQRSLLKEKNAQADFFWGEEDWMAFTAGYENV